MRAKQQNEDCMESSVNNVQCELHVKQLVLLAVYDSFLLVWWLPVPLIAKTKGLVAHFDDTSEVSIFMFGAQQE
jgi:hypothetical protein